MSFDIGEATERLGNEQSSGHSPTFPSLHLRHSSFSIPSEQSSAHSPTFPSLHLRHSSFSNPFVSLPTSQLILQPFRCFTYVTAHSLTLPSLYLRHSSFSIPSEQSSAHSPTFPSLHLRHSSFSNPSVALCTSQLILQPFRRFTYVTAHSPTLLSLLLRHRLFTYVTWQAVLALKNLCVKSQTKLLLCMGGSPGDVCEEPVTQKKLKKDWRMSCDVCEATEGLDNVV